MQDHRQRMWADDIEASGVQMNLVLEAELENTKFGESESDFNGKANRFLEFNRSRRPFELKCDTWSPGVAPVRSAELLRASESTNTYCKNDWLLKVKAIIKPRVYTLTYAFPHSSHYMLPPQGERGWQKSEKFSAEGVKLRFGIYASWSGAN